MKRAVSLACGWIFIGPLLAWQADRQAIEIKRLYVEPFAVKGGSEKLRKDVIVQLQRLNLISLVSTRSAADAVLSGDGEIWVKGYRSLNPRSGRSPSNGRPVYNGFLSVELKDAKGETVWSYLVTPGADSEDIAKDLSKRVVRHLSEALAPDDGGPAAPHR